MRTLSGNHKGWLNAIAKEVREAGQPVSLDFLYRVVPGQFATATNDGHVTAAENGLSRDDYAAGWRIWVEETVAALLKAGLVDAGDDGYTWAAEQDGTWKVKFRRGTYTLYGKSESALARDRHMLGDGAPGYLLKGWSEVEVDVETGVAGAITKGRHTLQVHPLAFAIPPMTLAEQEQVRADIAEHGVRLPLLLYPDASDKTARGKPKLKVLDGRHRLQFASALGKPVRVEVFDGTEQEARDLVWSLNGARRHLTGVQRSLALERLYGEQARMEAKKDQIEGAKQPKKVLADLPEPSGGKSDEGNWENRVIKKAGGKAAGVSARSIRHAREINQAPETAEAVDNGKITTVTEALEQAAIEKGKPPPTNVWQDSARSELGRARGHLGKVLELLDLPTGARPEELARLAHEVHRISGEIVAELERRGE